MAGISTKAANVAANRERRRRAKRRLLTGKHPVGIEQAVGIAVLMSSGTLSERLTLAHSAQAAQT